MDYFKHYASASDSKSLNIIFDKFGHKGIAFWWMFLELCSENWDGQSEPEFEFHSRTVVTKLKSSVRSVVPWLELCSDLGMCAFAHNSTKFSVKVPKLMEVKTSRNVIKSNKKQLPVYIEENRIEENRIEEKTKAKSVVDFSSVADAYNQILAGIGSIVHSPHFASSETIKNFFTLSGFKGFRTKQDWEDYFTLISKSDFLVGKNNSGFCVTIPWIMKTENAEKILGGQYSNKIDRLSVSEDELDKFFQKGLAGEFKSTEDVNA